MVFFDAYCKLDISTDIEVRVGDIVNYVRDEYSISPEDFCEFKENVEPFMTRLDAYVRDQMQIKKYKKEKLVEFVVLLNRVRAHDQMIFLFAHVLNEIQNGPVSSDYRRLVGDLSNLDTIVTFNWDTLLDHVLDQYTDWCPDNGYSVIFRNILDGTWRKQSNQGLNKSINYLKLHGSTNWLVNYMTWHLTSGNRIMISLQESNKGFTRISVDPKYTESIMDGKYIPPTIEDVDWEGIPPPGPNDPEGYPNLFIDGSKGYASYKNRFRTGYEVYSYFFPPNDPETHIPLMPLMIPPTQYKLYDEYAHIIDPLWDYALEQLSKSDNVFVIGYSLPKTDIRSLQMFQKADIASKPEWIIVNPYPEDIVERLVKEGGISQERIHVEAATLRMFLGN